MTTKTSTTPPSNQAVSRRALIGTIARIRAFEQKLLDLFSEGKLFGTTHTCIGQETCAAALYPHLDSTRDAIFTNHRCHGHYLAHGGSMRALMAEIMGKVGGICGGRGGSQHLCDGRFYSQGIQGGSMPIAAGYAHRLRLEGDGIVVAHIGDGTLGQGVVYETMNIASLLDLPLLVVIENNGLAQSTYTSQTTSGDIEARFSAFDVEVDRRQADDPLRLAEHLEGVVSAVRSGRPFVQILDTFRLMAHSKGDDDRDRAEVEAGWQNDFLAKLLEAEDADAVDAWDASRAEVNEIAESLEAAEWEPLEHGSAYAVPDAPLFTSSEEVVLSDGSAETSRRVNELLGEALGNALGSDQAVMVLGEDVLDPYGGAFKVSKGLSTRFSDRVFSTPISEQAIVGFGNGWSLAGGKAAVEIMFGDFSALATDQIVNQAAKMHFMYGGKARVPTTIRIASGGYRGYGPTHSQSLESMFCGVAGLKVVALSRRHRPQVLLEAALCHDPNPVIFVENKMLYSLRPLAGAPSGFRFVPTKPATSGDYPALVFTTTEADELADVTVVTYGGMTDMLEEALEQLILDEELAIDYFILSQLSPLDTREIVESVRVTRRLVTVEEGPERFGVGSEVASQVVGELGDCPVRLARVGAVDLPIPNSRVQECEVLPSKDRIVDAISSLF